MTINTQKQGVGAKVAIADPNDPTNVLKPNPDGSINSGGTAYEAVAASATAQVLGGAGATGDYLAGFIIQPATTTPGAVSILDGATTVYTFPGGTTTIAPIPVPWGARSVNGAWKVTTGTNVSVVAFGDFS